MKQGEFNKILTDIDDKYIVEAENYHVKRNYIAIIALVASCVVFCLIAIPIVTFITSLFGGNETESADYSPSVVVNSYDYMNVYNENYCLKNNIELDNIGDAEIIGGEGEMAYGNIVERSVVSYSRRADYLEEAEVNVNVLFDLANGAIFEGEILSLDEKQVDFDGVISICTIAKIKVIECFERYRTNHFTKDEEVELLIPGQISDGGVAGSLKVGRKAIFFAKEYMEDDYWVQNNTKIQLSTLALCGVYDRNNYMIIEMEDGLIFSSQIFTEFDYTTTLDDAVKFVKEKVEKLTK